MRYPRWSMVLFVSTLLLSACDKPAKPFAETCILSEDNSKPAGTTSVKAEVVVSGLEVPWGFVFLPNGSLLITERPGRLRLANGGLLEEDPVLTINTGSTSEGGLLDIALHPGFDFQDNRDFYLYYTTTKDSTTINRVERFTLAPDAKSATSQGVILDNIPAARFHNGGRLRFGPKGNLFVGTGDARNPDNSQNKDSLAGKILRIKPDGSVPSDNPFPNNPVYLWGIRNTQGFVWADGPNMWVTDHGPSGELGRSGHDELSYATPGSNLGWPTIFGCESKEGLVSPSLAWQTALPPGGAALYTGTAIADWTGSLLIGALGDRQLHRVVFDPNNPRRVSRHEAYFRGDPPEGWGRLREVKMGADGNLYVSTSNCDGRGTCPADKDKILRIVPGP